MTRFQKAKAELQAFNALSEGIRVRLDSFADNSIPLVDAQEIADDIREQRDLLRRNIKRSPHWVHRHRIESNVLRSELLVRTKASGLDVAEISRRCRERMGYSFCSFQRSVSSYWDKKHAFGG